MDERVARKYVWWGWGALDALYMLNYVAKSVLQDRLPFFSDALSALRIIDDHGSYAAVFITLGWCLQLSIAASGILLLRRNRWGERLVWLQLPFRLLLFVPSASVLFYYMAPHFSQGSVVGIALVVASELAKVWSLWFFKESAPTTGSIT